MVARNIYCFKEHTHLQDQDQPPSKIALRYACPGGIPPFPPGIPGVSRAGSRLFQVGSRVGLWNIPHGIPPGIMENPAWDPTWDYGTSHMESHLGLWNIPHGIPPEIMEHPAWDPTWDRTWDPTWDYGTSCMGSHKGSCLKCLIASHLGKHIPGGIKP